MTMIDRINYLTSEIEAINETLADGIDYCTEFIGELRYLLAEYSNELAALRKEAAKFGFVAI